MVCLIDESGIGPVCKLCYISLSDTSLNAMRLYFRFKLIPSTGWRRIDMLSRAKLVFMLTSKTLNITYQLLQVPSTDLHVTTVLIQALCKLLSVDLAASCAPVILFLLP
jgi:hypothetical protein